MDNAAADADEVAGPGEDGVAVEEQVELRVDVEDELFAGLTDNEREKLRLLLLALRDQLERNSTCVSADAAERS